METISNPLLRVAPLDRHRRHGEGGRRAADCRQHFRHAADFPAAGNWRRFRGSQPDEISFRARRRAGRDRGDRRRRIWRRCDVGARRWGPCWGRSRLISPCAASRGFRCAWNGSAPMRAASRAGWPRIRRSSAFISRRTRSIPMPRSSSGFSRRISMAPW